MGNHQADWLELEGLFWQRRPPGRLILWAETGWCQNPGWELLAFLLLLAPSRLRPELQALSAVLLTWELSLIFDSEARDGFHENPRGQGERLWRHYEDDPGEDCGLKISARGSGRSLAGVGESEMRVCLWTLFSEHQGFPALSCLDTPVIGTGRVRETVPSGEDQ